MALAKYQVWTCDRCECTAEEAEGSREPIRTLPDGWGQLTIGPPIPAMKINSHLCAECRNKLRIWFNEGKPNSNPGE
jgi:hypothetical protein